VDQLTTDQRAQLADLAGRLEPRQQQLLDPRKAADLEMIGVVLELFGKSGDRYPALHAALADGRAPQEGLDDVLIVDVGADSGGRATARGWHTARGGAFLSSAMTIAFDTDSNELLATGSATQVGGTLARSATRTATAKPAGRSVSAVTLFHAQRTPSEAPRFGFATAQRPTVGGAALINIIHPVLKVPTNKQITIGFARTAPAADCDYFYKEPENIESPLLIVPFEGNATLADSIVTDSTGKNIPGLEVFTRVYVTGAQEPYVEPIDPTSLKAKVTVPNPSQPTVMQWSFPYDQLGQALTQSIRYAPCGPARSNISSFFFEFKVPVHNSLNPIFPFAVCSEHWPNQPSVQCTEIKDLQFWWHCLAAGTAVTLADGSTLPIEEVDNKVRVRTGLGDGSLAVEATWRGGHEDPDGTAGGVLRLVTDGGRELVLSGEHPVITPVGPVLAHDLRPGATVLSASGPEGVRSCEAIPHSGPLHSLKLGDQDDRAAGAGLGFASFLANGIAVGDHESLAKHYDATRHDADYMLARLPPEQHTDYLSALADIAAGR
jgi:hypothetical protein